MPPPAFRWLGNFIVKWPKVAKGSCSFRGYTAALGGAYIDLHVCAHHGVM